MTRAHASLACSLVLAVSLCSLRYSPALEQPPVSPSQQDREQQLHEAARLQGQPKQDCVWISQRVCVSAAELKRREGRK